MKICYGPLIHWLASSREAREEVVENSLRRAGLWNEVKDRLKAPGTSLSGGQQQRLCIARAIAVNPEVILMGEPCSALDPIATAKIEELMDELRKNFTSSSSPIRCSRPRAYRSALPSSTWDNSWSGARRRRSSPPRATSARRATSPAASVEELARRKRARDNAASKDKHEMNSQHIVKSFAEELQRLSAVPLRTGTDR